LNGAWRLKAVLPRSPSSSVVAGLNGTVLQPVVAKPYAGPFTTVGSTYPIAWPVEM
jgi:hypothetical protein